VKFAVEFTPTAQAELWAAFEYIHERAPLNAARWLRGIYKAIDTLESFPSRCGIAPESKYLDAELRHLVFKSHRVIFFIDQPARTVRILYVRHGSMRGVGESAPDGGDEENAD
jgi:plasmid stabilization system protein ParE